MSAVADVAADHDRRADSTPAARPGDAMFITQEAPLAPHRAEGHRRHDRAAVARRDGAGRAALGADGRKRKLRLVAIEMVHGAAGSTAFGAKKNLWAPAATGSALRPVARPRWRRSSRTATTSPSSATPTCATPKRSLPPEIGGDHFRSAAVFLTQSHPKQTQGSDLLRRHLARPDLRAEVRPGDADSVDAAVHRERRPGRRLLLRLLVRLHRLDQLGVAERAAADDSRSARGVRSAVRRRRHAGSARAPAASDDRSILDWVDESVGRAEGARSAPPTARGSPTTSTTCARSSAASRRSRRRTRSGEPRELPGAPIGVPDSYEEHVKLMFDLQAVAFASDITRVFAFKMSRDVSNRVFPETGVNTGFHIASHHGEREDRILDFAKINTLPRQPGAVPPREAEEHARRRRQRCSTTR